MFYNHHTAVGPARLGQEEKDFTQLVMQWKLKLLRAAPPPFTALTRAPKDYKSYLNSLWPLIMEDARASVAAGLEQAHNRYDRVYLTSNVRPPSDPNNPWKLEFRGAVSIDDDSFLNTSVIMLKHKKKDGTFETLLGIANARSGETDKFHVKAYIRQDIRDDYMLHRDARWQATFLASIVTHNRMFDACKELAKWVPGLGSCIAKVVSSIIPLPPLPYVTTTMEGLNHSQTRAVVTFRNMSEGFLMLQGPPGTGKTTTITTMLHELFLSHTRTLVCAPSNKAVQVLAQRFLKTHPGAAVIFVGVESKLQAELLPIAYHSFFDRLRDTVSRCVKVVNMSIAAQAAKVEQSEWTYSDQEIAQANQHFADIKQSIEGVAATVAPYAIASSIAASITKTQERVVYLHKHCTDRGTIRDINSSDLVKGGYGVYWQELCLALNKLLLLLNTDGTREDIETAILHNSRIVFCTLSVSGRDAMLKMPRPAVLIVDEAGQSVEAETLIAFQHQPRKVLLVGDTKQLPATVKSQAAKDAHYDWSMMHRLADICGQPTLMLEEQYRMHPSISSWPSKRYYGGLLRDNVGIATRAPLPGCPDWMHPCAFYDLPPSKHNHQQSEGTSTKNEHEAQYIALAVSKLRAACTYGTIGIITPYAAQVRCIEAALKKEKVKTSAALRVSSVDGFQGDECDFIFISFVRTKRVGFVDHAERLNVAITRAKYGLFMVGSETTLKASPEFESLFADAKERENFHTEAALMATLGIPVTPPPPATRKHRWADKAHALGTVTADAVPALPTSPVVTNKRRSGKKADTQTATPDAAVPAPPTAPVVTNKSRSGEKADAQTATPAAAVPAPPTPPETNKRRSENKVAVPAATSIPLAPPASAAKQAPHPAKSMAAPPTRTKAGKLPTQVDLDMLALDIASGLRVDAPVLKRSSGPPCVHFAKGSCKYGNTCKFLHD